MYIFKDIFQVQCCYLFGWFAIVDGHRKVKTPESRLKTRLNVGSYYHMSYILVDMVTLRERYRFISMGQYICQDDEDVEVVAVRFTYTEPAGHLFTFRGDARITFVVDGCCNNCVTYGAYGMRSSILVFVCWTTERCMGIIAISIKCSRAVCGNVGRF